MKIKKMLCILVSLASTGVNAALITYTSNGVHLVYSNVSNVTWVQDANLLFALENAFGYENIVNDIIAVSPSVVDTPNYWDTPSNSGFHTVSFSDFSSGGLASWFGAKAFITYLNSINYGGVNQWRLPSAGNKPEGGFDFHQPSINGNEFMELFYTELRVNASGLFPKNAQFTNVNDYEYWFGNEWFGIDGKSVPNGAWYFDMRGQQSVSSKFSYPFYVWPVSPGQISTIPIPTSYWLFISAIVGVVVASKKS